MTPPTLVGTVLDGKFRIERALASGASGDVYEAYHLALASKVAVKVLRPGAPETAHIRRKRFVREARVAARIQSDHVVRVFDVVAPEGGLIYIVMELLTGETLASRIKRGGAVPPGEAVDYVLQAAKPLAQMHDAGIVHRDVKPSNIFLARDADGTERVKLLDFGVAAFRQPFELGDASITHADAFIGTPRYMAPEQVRASKHVDARADVWALGVTLYELLSGSRPFDGKTVHVVLNQIEQQDPLLLSERQPTVPAGLADVVHRCLAKDPDSRPADARALAVALAPYAPDPAALGDLPAQRPSGRLSPTQSDDGVEVVFGAPSMLRTRLAGLLGRREVVLPAGFGIVVITLLATLAMRGHARQLPVVGMSVSSASPPTAPAESLAVAPTHTAEAPSSVPSAPVSPGPSADSAIAHRTAQPSSPPSAPTRSGKSPHPRTKRPLAQDDDRIE